MQVITRAKKAAGWPVTRGVKHMFGWIGTIVGILLLLFAAFLIFFFPGTKEHQSQGWEGVVFGFVAGVIGAGLLLLP